MRRKPEQIIRDWTLCIGDKRDPEIHLLAFACDFGFIKLKDFVNQTSGERNMMKVETCRRIGENVQSLNTYCETTVSKGSLRI